jgi:hypothetical protein
MPLIPYRGNDWDELLPFINRDTFRTSKAFKKCEALGDLALAKTAQEHLETHQRHEKEIGRLGRVFEFEGCTYGWKVIRNRETKEDETLVILIYGATLKPSATYVEIDGVNSSGGQNRKHSFVFEVSFSDKKTKIHIELEAEDFKSHQALKVALLKKADLVLRSTGDEWIGPILEFLRETTPKTVQKIPFSGFYKPTLSFLTPGWGVDSKGDLILPDSTGSFDVGPELAIQPEGHGLFASSPIEFKKKTERKKLLDRFIKSYLQAYPETAVLQLNHLAITLIQELIKDAKSGVPFLAFNGEPGSGKTDRCNILLNILGVASSGFSVSSTRTAGALRSLSQLSGLPILLDETNEDGRQGSKIDQKIKEFEEIAKGLYKGTNCQVQGRRDNSNKTHINKCLSSFWFCHNSDPFDTEAMRQRTILSITSKSEQNESTIEALRMLHDLIHSSDAQLIGIAFIEQLLPLLIAEWQTKRDEARKELRPITNTDERILEDFSLFLGVSRIASRVLGNEELNLEHTKKGKNIFKYIEAQTVEVRANRSPIIGEFFNTLVELQAIDPDKEGFRGEVKGEFHRWLDEGLYFVFGEYSKDSRYQNSLIVKDRSDFLNALKKILGAKQQPTRMYNSTTGKYTRASKGWCIPNAVLFKIVAP